MVEGENFMRSIRKYIFIKNNESLIFQLDAEIEEIRHFFFGVLKCLTDGNVHKQQPLEITCKEKQFIVDFLNLRYSSDKKINKLIHFFSTIEENNFVYFWPYNENVEDIYDLMKESLSYYDQGCSQEEVLDKMKGYINAYNFIKEMMEENPYVIRPIIPTHKVIEGKSNKAHRKCIYCNGFQGDEKNTSFVETAHAIPEALGNKKFIQNEECDTCNSYFAQNAEEDLSNMLMFNRLKYGIKGKNGYPIFQIGSRKYARYFDWKEEDYNKDWGCFEVAKNLIRQEGVIGPVIVDIGGKKVDNQVRIANIKDYSPMHVYKALVKCVMGLIGNDKLDVFKNTLHWLRYDNSYHKLPEIALVKCNRIIEEPELYIFERKETKNYEFPYCYGEIRFMDQIFIVIIPFCTKDKKKFRKIEDEVVFNNYLKSVYGTYELCDFSETNNKCIEQIFTKTREICI